MSDEFESINSRMPDLQSVLMNRIAAQKAQTSAAPAPGTFDPYHAMLKKKEQETAPIDPSTIQKWPSEDTQKLEDFCKKVGIVGFNCGRMHPIAALAMLKKQFGDFAGTPLEERVPEGYQKLGSNPANNPSYPYSQAVNQRRILHD